MFFERLKATTRTLRFRLMVWNTLVVLLTAAATLIGLREGVRYSLAREMDQLLLEDMEEIRIGVTERNRANFVQLHRDLDRKARGHVHHGWYVKFFNPKMETLWVSSNAPLTTLEMPPVPDLEPVNCEGYRQVQARMTDGSGQTVIVRVGTSLETLHANIRRIDRLVALAACVVLVLAVPCGYWLAGRATRPLADMMHTTSRLRPEKLDERLRLRDTGDELDQFAGTVNRLLDRIAAYLDQHRDYLADAAHELRTPLAAIRSSVEVSLGGDRSREEYQELLYEVIEECTSLESLVNQLLLLAESDADRLKTTGELIDLEKLVDRTVDMFRGIAESRRQQLTAETAPGLTVEGNRAHLRQVLNNLLDNAVKFTPEGGTIRVTLSRTADRKSAVLQVSDSGCGIAAEDLPHVFDRFFRADRSRGRDVPTRGTGLGLSICQAVVQGHSGKITAESEIDRGSVFTVTLPLAQSTAASRPAEAATTT